MAAWYEGLSLLARVFLFIALPASVIMLIQTVMLFFGFGGGEGGGIGTESEISGLEDHGDGGMQNEAGETASAGLRFVTTRGIIAFLTVAGWTGLVCLELGVPQPLSVLLAAVCGFAAMVGVAYMVRGLMSLASVHRMDYRTALGCIAEVYLRIPGDGSMGKIYVTVNGTLRECDAVAENGKPIGTGQKVRVTDILSEGVMVVELVETEGAAVVDMARTKGREN